MASLRSGRLFAPDPELLVRHLLGLPVRPLEDEPAALAVERHLLVSVLPVEVDGLSGTCRKREVERVLGDRRLDGGADLGLGTEEPVRGSEAGERLMRAREVVVRDPISKALASLDEVLRFDALPEFPVDGRPHPLRLANSLRMMCSGDHVLDALADEQLLEGGLPPPREVLPALVGQHFLGLPELLDSVELRVHDQVLGLPERERIAHDEPAVVVQEDRQVHALLLALQHEGRDVRLPELARPCPLEPADLIRRPPLPLRRRNGLDPLGLQGRAHAA
jgi:hypothetical protein